MKLYNVFYKDWNHNKKEYQCTTDNFEKWLKEHNTRRIADGNEKEDANNFEVEETGLYLYDEKIII
tara:strand:+ start:538 stop:735 length:198 start_codon:yes stop_codon:yes gene_type:complete